MKHIKEIPLFFKTIEKKIGNTDMDKMREYASIVAREMAMKSVKLSEEKGLDFLIGLLKSGDLVKYVSMSDNGDSEGWSYIPYRDVHDLKVENEKLKNQLKDIVEIICSR